MHSGIELPVEANSRDERWVCTQVPNGEFGRYCPPSVDIIQRPWVVGGCRTYPQPRRTGQPPPDRLLAKDGLGTLVLVCYEVRINHCAGRNGWEAAHRNIPPPLTSFALLLRWS